MRARGQTNPRGFTLVELMIAVTILMILALMAFPTIRSGLARQHMVSATNEVMNIVDVARIQAIARNRAYVLRIVAKNPNGSITLDESSTTRCADVATGTIKNLRSLTFNSGDFRDVRIVQVVPADLGGTYDLCFRPDGRVVRSDTSKPLPSTDSAYGAGEARIVLQRLGGGQKDQPQDVPHQIVVPYNGIPRFEPGFPQTGGPT